MVDDCVSSFCRVDPPAVAWKRLDLRGAQRQKEIGTGSDRFRLQRLTEASRTDENSPVRTPALINVINTRLYDSDLQINRSNLRSTDSLKELKIRTRIKISTA